MACEPIELDGAAGFICGPRKRRPRAVKQTCPRCREPFTPRRGATVCTDCAADLDRSITP